MSVKVEQDEAQDTNSDQVFHVFSRLCPSKQDSLAASSRFQALTLRWFKLTALGSECSKELVQAKSRAKASNSTLGRDGGTHRPTQLESWVCYCHPSSYDDIEIFKGDERSEDWPSITGSTWFIQYVTTRLNSNIEHHRKLKSSARPVKATDDRCDPVINAELGWSKVHHPTPWHTI